MICEFVMFARMNFEDLELLLSEMDMLLVTDVLSLDEYDVMWIDTITVSGWTIVDFEDEIDRRWELPSSTRRTIKQLSPNN